MAKGVVSFHTINVKGEQMSVLVRITAPGMEASTYEEMTPMVHPLMKTQPGFIIHIAYPTPGGFAVGEVWESKAQHDAWYNENIAPNLPEGANVTKEYVELHTVVQP
jgi:heme-degrading monooxygenase HmoA